MFLLKPEAAYVKNYQGKTIFVREKTIFVGFLLSDPP